MNRGGGDGVHKSKRTDPAPYLPSDDMGTEICPPTPDLLPPEAGGRVGHGGMKVGEPVTLLSLSTLESKQHGTSAHPLGSMLKLTLLVGYK